MLKNNIYMAESITNFEATMVVKKCAVEAARVDVDLNYTQDASIKKGI